MFRIILQYERYAVSSLSIIVIGLNEGWKISMCLSSIYESLELAKMHDYEIIYVDSQSTDDSIMRVLKYPNVVCVKLTGECNAAIARNVGATIATGDILLFLDGDMELVPNAFKSLVFIFNNENPKFFSGNLLHKFYNSSWELIRTASLPQYPEDRDLEMSNVGGFFFIDRSVWKEVGGMKNYLWAGEDVDLALRLAQKGIRLRRLKEVMVLHHTLGYLNKARKWKLLFSKRYIHGKSIVFRENLSSINSWKRFIRHDYSVLFLGMLIVCASYFQNVLFILPYLLILLVKVSRKGVGIKDITFFLVRDLFVLLSFFLYYPGKNRKVSYQKVSTDVGT